MAGFIDITGGQNLLVLAAAPGEESLYCGALIAEASARGRPPFLAILTDGSTLPGDGPADRRAAVWESQTRAASACLGVPHDWFLMLGLHDGTAPTAGPKFDAVVRAVSMIMWRRDCNAIIAPGAGRGDRAGCHAIAAQVAAQSGVRLIRYGVAGGLALHSPRGALRRADALAIHGMTPRDVERYAAA